MKFGMYCFFNSNVSVCGCVDFSRNDEEAMKKFSDSLNHLPEKEFKQLQSDVLLMKVADFDLSNCEVVPCEHYVVMCGDEVIYVGGVDVDEV